MIEIVDAHSAGWGHVLVDQIVLTDRRVQPVDPKTLPDNGTMTMALLDGEGISFAALFVPR